MHRRWIRPIFVIVIIVTVLLICSGIPVRANDLTVQTNQPLPTVTGTPSSPIVTVSMENDQINVRSGPGQLYPKVGVLLAGQAVPAKGKSPKGEWILIEYPGVAGGTAWVYSYLLIIPPGINLPIVEPPPEPTPLYTATIDPTLASQFIITLAPTRLPTFTPPAPLVIPTLRVDGGARSPTGIPMGLVIVILGSLGVLLGFLSLIRGR